MFVGGPALPALIPALFNKPQALFNYSPGSLVTGLGGTFTRSGTATYVDANGVVQTAATDVIRDGHYIGGVRTTLLEGARTNQCLQSGSLNNSTKNAVTLSLAAVTSPVSGLSASKIVPSAASSGHDLAVNVGTTSAATWTVSGLVCAAGYPRFGIRIYDGTSYFIRATLDLSLGTIVNLAAGTASITAHPFGGGWYSVVFTGTSVAAFSSGAFAIESLPAGKLVQDSFTGDGTSGTYACAFNVELGSFPSSYIPTTSSAVTRNADSLTFPWGSLPMAQTAYVKGIFMGDLSNTVLSFESTTPANPRMLLDGTGTKIRVYHHNGSAAVTSVPAAAPSVGDTVEWNATLASTGADQMGQTLNGGTEAVAALSGTNALAAAWSTPTVLGVGSDSGTANVQFFAFIAVKVASGVCSLNQMRAL